VPAHAFWVALCGMVYALLVPAPVMPQLGNPPLFPPASPDFMGEEGHDLCILLNEAYDTLSNPDLRAAYNAKLEQTLIDFEDDYTGKALSKWMPTIK
jgi:hypothetical protein